jgi:hypothetical protein
MARIPSLKADGQLAPRLFWLFLIALLMQTMDATAQLYFHPFHHQVRDMAVTIPGNTGGQRHHTGLGRIASSKFLDLGALIKHLTPHARLANNSVRLDVSVPQR